VAVVAVVAAVITAAVAVAVAPATISAVTAVVVAAAAHPSLKRARLTSSTVRVVERLVTARSSFPGNQREAHAAWQHGFAIREAVFLWSPKKREV
jgi:hypothetical protein